ncbi:MAG: tRNA lysidine(34) synthetase TilS, partial [Caldilineaceae bacterium]|nr:tRNA lysidine(34) synthetase TilS [Caldilineaceae bacterium]
MTTDSLVTLVEQMQARYQLFPKYNATAAETPVVVVAVSGGADSVCLLALLQQVAAAWRLTLHVAHLDHALRPDSAADAEFVATLAATYGVPFHIKRVQPGELAAHEGGIEAAARRTRYEFLAQVALTVTPATQTPTVALAHHADDQAETVLHHLVRGSGLQGLGGMRPVATYLTEGTPLDLRLVRPLLYARRAAIQQYLQEHELSWREDSTNVDQRYTRNYLRHTVLPALTTVNPQAVESIGRAAQLAAEEHDRLVAYDAQLLRSLQWSPPSDEQIAAIVANSTNAPPGGRRSELVLNLAALTAYPHATQRALLRLAHTWVAPVPTELSLARLDQLCA